MTDTKTTGLGALAANPADTDKFMVVDVSDTTMFASGTNKYLDASYIVFATKAQTLTNKTLTTPTIASFANAGHNHQDAAGGGQLDHGAALTGLGDDDHTQYLLATGARTGASSQAQTFTNGIVAPSAKPGSDSVTGFQILDAGATAAIFNIDTSNQRVGISQTAPAGKLHVVKTPLTNVSNAHRDTSNSTILLESSDAVVQLIADEAGISASGILLSQVPGSGDNKHWLLSGMGPSRSNRFQICYGTTTTGGNVFGTIDLLTPIVVITTGGLTGLGGVTSPTSRLHLGGDLSASAWGTNGIHFRSASATFTNTSTAASGTATNAVANSFGQPTFAATNSSVTMTNAATVYIANAPTAGTNVTLTNAYALWVDDGASRFDGNIGFFGAAPGSKPTITGSRDSNAALASLLTALATLGLITDSTS